MSIDTWAGLITPHGPHYDGNGRYKLRLPGEAKATGRTRMTTYIKDIDRADTLIPWSMVMALQGFGKNTDIRARWSALTARSADPYYDNEATKAEAKEIAKAAKEAGGANSRRDIGTAVHDMVEAVVTGKADLASVDDEWRPLVTNILQAISDAGFVVVPEMCERTVYNAEHDIVGRFDITLQHIETSEYVIADLKTGGVSWKPDLDWKTKRQKGWRDAHVDNDLSEAMQLAGYAGALHIIEWPVDPNDECTVIEPPEWSQEYGVIIHAPSTGADVSLRYLDLSIGRQGLETVRSIRQTKRLKPLMRREGAPAPTWPPLAVAPTPIVEQPTERPFITGRIDAIKTHTEAWQWLRTYWPADVPTPKAADGRWADDHATLIEQALVRCEAEYRLPFEPTGEPAPVELVDTTPVVATQPKLDDGPLEPEMADALIAKVKALGAGARAQLNAWVAQANDAGTPLGLRSPQWQTRRRCEIARAILLAIDGELSDDPDADLRALLCVVLGAEPQASIPTGAVLGALSLDEAQRLAALLTA